MVAPVIIPIGDGTGQGLDGVTVNAGPGNASREMVAIGDATDPLAYAQVSSTFATSTSYALITRLAAAPANRQAAGIVSSATAVVSTSVDGTAMSIIRLQISSTNAMSFVFESSNDNAVSWNTTNAWQMPAGTVTTNAASSGTFAIPNVMGSDSVRVRATSTTANATTNVSIQCNAGAGIVYAVQPTAAALNCTATVSGTVTATVQGTSNAIASPTTGVGSGLVSIFSSTATSAVILKAGAGNLYSLNVCAQGVAGFLQLYNASTVPADNTTTTPIRVWPIAANAGLDINLAYPLRCSTGAVLSFSSSGPFSKFGMPVFLAGECL